MNPKNKEQYNCTHDCTFCVKVKQENAIFKGICDNIKSIRYALTVNENDRCDRIDVM